MLVVDDEPDNLDLLYRTFRREFNVLRAESGHEALNLLKEHGEVAVIISDQRMPEMKGTEFLSRTVPEFPDTVRIILTGFTDVEDLVDAINAGQVYRYITKPWDPDALKRVVQQAARTYEILKQRGDALMQVELQEQLMTILIDQAATAADPAALAAAVVEQLQQAVGASGCIVYGAAGNAPGPTLAVAGTASGDTYKDDPLLTTVITEQKPAIQPNLAASGSAPAVDGVQARMVLPACFQGQVQGGVVLEWATPQGFSETTTKLVSLVAAQLGFALAYQQAKA
ncbi:MAG: response regulator [Leptolyngbya sp.]|nr:response regulator [Leptolyngbya sp.]